MIHSTNKWDPWSIYQLQYCPVGSNLISYGRGVALVVARRNQAGSRDGSLWERATRHSSAFAATTLWTLKLFQICSVKCFEIYEIFPSIPVGYSKYYVEYAIPPRLLHVTQIHITSSLTVLLKYGQLNFLKPSDSISGILISIFSDFCLRISWCMEAWVTRLTLIQKFDKSA